MNVQLAHDMPKDAAKPVVERHRATRETLPFSDTRDFADAARGFLGTREGVRILSDKGRIVWSLEPYEFVNDDEAPPTVNPSLWRQSRLNMYHGLFEVTEGVYQVRGFDAANMTLVEGDTGVIVVDCLTTVECAKAAMDLYFEHRGRRPVVAVLFTHTHGDHWGGALGVLTAGEDDHVPVIAPHMFMEHTVSENIIAGPAMRRRATYQFGPLLEIGPRGQVDIGLGKAIAQIVGPLIRPTDLITATGETRVIDGVEFQFQMAPNSEAPAEMHFFVPRYKVLNLAENCCHTFHNLLPFRGAEVRDALLWSRYLGEALQMWGGKAVAMCGQHNWPVWGDRVDAMISEQRDLYKFVHDQTLRLINHGLTATEIAETIRLPTSLENAWHARGYYGHVRHNVKAIYQKYIGWYDANPANLDPLPPEESGRKFVEYMGGAEAILGRARMDFKKGEYRFVAQALSHLVFAEPDNKAARSLLADAFEQLGYLAESSTWRNAYLFGAQELRQGMIKSRARTVFPSQTLNALSTEQIWDLLGIRLNGPKADGKRMVINWRFTDTQEDCILNLENSALTHVPMAQAPSADATCTLARCAFTRIVAAETSLADEIVNGHVAVTGDAGKVGDLLALLDEFPRMFEIVEPKRFQEP